MLHHRRAVSRWVLLLLVIGSVAGCASSHRNSSAAQAGGPASSSSPVGATVTKTRVFAPFDRSGRAAAGVAAHRSGSCFTSSITVSGTSAYRCFAANALLDPCFAVPNSAHLLDCYADPWSRATQLRVSRLPRPASTVDVARPWALELSDGTHCVVTNGTATIVRHIALVYQCRTGLAGLIGSPRAQVLQALYRSTDGVVRTIRVSIAWRAR